MRKYILMLILIIVLALAAGSTYWLSQGQEHPGSVETRTNPRTGMTDTKEVRTSQDAYVEYRAEQREKKPQVANDDPSTLTLTPEQYFLMTPLGQEVQSAGRKMTEVQQAAEIEKESLSECVELLLSEPLSPYAHLIARSGPQTLSSLLRDLHKNLRVARLMTIAKLGDEPQRAELLTEIEAALDTMMKATNVDTLRMAIYGKSNEIGGAVALPMLLAELDPTPKHIEGTVALYDRSLELHDGNMCFDMGNPGFTPEINCHDGARLVLVYGMEQMLTQLFADMEQNSSLFLPTQVEALQAYKDLVEGRRELARTAAEMINKTIILRQDSPVDVENPAELDRIFTEGAEIIHMLTQSEYSQTTPGLYSRNVMAIAREYLE